MAKIEVGSTRRFRTRYFDANGKETVAPGVASTATIGPATVTVDGPNGDAGFITCSGAGSAQVVVSSPGLPAATLDLEQSEPAPGPAATATVELE